MGTTKCSESVAWVLHTTRGRIQNPNLPLSEGRSAKAAQRCRRERYNASHCTDADSSNRNAKTLISPHDSSTTTRCWLGQRCTSPVAHLRLAPTSPRARRGKFPPPSPSKNLRAKWRPRHFAINPGCRRSHLAEGKRETHQGLHIRLEFLNRRFDARAPTLGRVNAFDFWRDRRERWHRSICLDPLIFEDKVPAQMGSPGCGTRRPSSGIPSRVVRDSERSRATMTSSKWAATASLSVCRSNRAAAWSRSMIVEAAADISCAGPHDAHDGCTRSPRAGRSLVNRGIHAAHDQRAQRSHPGEMVTKILELALEKALIATS